MKRFWIFCLFALVAAQETTLSSVASEMAPRFCPRPSWRSPSAPSRVPHDSLHPRDSESPNPQVHNSYRNATLGGGGAPEAVPAPPDGTASGAPASSPETSSVPSGTAEIYHIAAGPTHQVNNWNPSVAQIGRLMLLLGTIFAGLSMDGGVSYDTLGVFNGISLLVDQKAIADPVRGFIIWLRTGQPEESQWGFRLDFFSLNVIFDCFYHFSAPDINSTWDPSLQFSAPYMQVGPEFLYLSFDLSANGFFVRSVLLRMPLDTLSACGNLNYRYFYSENDAMGLVTAGGITDTAYFASNTFVSGGSNRLRIYLWPELSNALTFFDRQVSSWTPTFFNGLCGTADGNWASRLMQALQTGALYQIPSLFPGRTIVGFWWNVAQGGAFPVPYIEAAAFFADTLLQLPGPQGRPLIWDTQVCYSYPAVAPNARGDLAIVFSFGDGSAENPSVGFALADSFVPPPPGWQAFAAARGTARPSESQWGDWNALQPFYPGALSWVGGSHFISEMATPDCSLCSNGFYWNFGRAQDCTSWAGAVGMTCS